MVHWLGPKALVSTAADVVISGLFGKYADKRELEGAWDPPEPFSVAGNGTWIDYIADVGDGWNSTYTMAWLLTRDPSGSQLDPELASLNGTERGSIVIFGGDEVYPKAGWDDYRQRLVVPYETATNSEETARSVFAIPGNHDWYDGLTSFMRIFCRGGAFANWSTRQKRSYFAIHLPGNWWLLGIDVAFDYYIDEAQLAYFNSLRCHASEHNANCANRIHSRDRIVLCTAKPAWEEARLRGDFKAKKQTLGRRALFEFERNWGNQIELVLSGDLHHYAHYVPASGDGPHRITAGGGGAFFYPSHRLPEVVEWPSEVEPGDPPPSSLSLTRVFPEPRQSWKWLPLLPVAPLFANPTFAIAVGTIYLMLGLSAPGSLHPPEGTILGSAAPSAFLRLWVPPTARPILVILSLAVLASLVAFADAKSWIRGLALAVPHWLAQLFMLLLAASLAETLACRMFSDSAAAQGVDHLPFVGAAALVLFVTGGIGGSLVFGCYLLASQLLGRHANEAFAAMHLSSYKNFLRLHIDPEGNLSAYSFGVKKACRHWKRTEDGRGMTPRRRTPGIELIERVEI